jgi:hypothetical protein
VLVEISQDGRNRPRQLHWEPQPGPQEMLLACPLEDIGFGGARGGGKTAGMLGDFLFMKASTENMLTVCSSGALTPNRMK